MSNAETVQAIYEAFGRGDVPFILDQVSDSVEWEYSSSANVPWLQRQKGKAGVGAFFESLAGFQITKFVPTKILDGGDVVVALIDIEGTVQKTGALIAEDDEVHVWRFDGQGKVVRFAHKLDSYAHWKAYHG
jgi:ketosteroid isomerase-like protein